MSSKEDGKMGNSSAGCEGKGEGRGERGVRILNITEHEYPTRLISRKCKADQAPIRRC